MTDLNRLLQPQPGGRAGHFRLTAAPDLCVGPPGQVFLFGGAGLGAAVAAAEAASGRRVIQAGAQYLSYAPMGAELDLEVKELVAGRNISQLRVSARHGERLIFEAAVALGDRLGQPEHQWIEAPEMPTPDACLPGPVWPRQGGQLHARLDLRLHPDHSGGQGHNRIDPQGRTRLWIRDRNGSAVDAAFLAVVADFVPSGAAMALGRIGGGNSLDNTLRIRALAPTDWVLCDIQVEAAARGFIHGRISMFSRDGQLLATGSQSLILRDLPI